METLQQAGMSASDVVVLGAIVGSLVIAVCLFFAPLFIWAATAKTARIAREQVGLSEQIVRLLEKSQGVLPADSCLLSRTQQKRAARQAQNKLDQDILARARGDLR